MKLIFIAVILGLGLALLYTATLGAERVTVVLPVPSRVNNDVGCHWMHEQALQWADRSGRYDSGEYQSGRANLSMAYSALYRNCMGWGK
jgi:hypothetical protein